ncbi:MAG: hypothetical protein O4807_20360 [Trichodesmium sp. St19_bin2]|nr:hypothetical protein [Trichodesmium sp. St19_bin2]
MNIIIAILGISTLLLSLTHVAKAQLNSLPPEATVSGDSLKTVEGRSITNDNYQRYIDESESNGIKPYELRRQQEDIEVRPGVSIPTKQDKPKLGSPFEESALDGEKSVKGFKLKLGI